MAKMYAICGQDSGMKQLNLAHSVRALGIDRSSWFDPTFFKDRFRPRARNNTRKNECVTKSSFHLRRYFIPIFTNIVLSHFAN